MNDQSNGFRYKVLYLGKVYRTNDRKKFMSLLKTLPIYGGRDGVGFDFVYKIKYSLEYDGIYTTQFGNRKWTLYDKRESRK